MSRPALLATRGATDSRRAALVILAAVGLSIAVAVGLLAVSGQLKGWRSVRSSALVRYGLPLVRAVHDLAAALTVGLARGRYVVLRARARDAGR
jgi:putative copper resistance protein D